MARYKGKSYKVNLTKANRDYKCAISNEPIFKGEYYLNIQIEDSNNPRKIYQSYTPMETLHISKHLLACHNMDEILELTGHFRAKEKYCSIEKYEALYQSALGLAENISKLQHENQNLKRLLVESELNKTNQDKMSVDDIEIGDMVTTTHNQQPRKVVAVGLRAIRVEGKVVVDKANILKIYKCTGQVLGIPTFRGFEVDK